MKRENRVERISSKIRSNPIVSLGILLGTIVITLSTFTDAAKNLLGVVAQQTPAEARAELGRMSLQYTPGDFVRSAKTGDLTAVRSYLTAGMKPNATTPSDAYGTNGAGWTAVMSAASEGQTTG
jgi:hypothetical protein